MTTFTRRTDWVDGGAASVHATDLLRYENGIFNALDTSDSGTQSLSSSVTLPAEKRITLTSNANTGSVSRLIEFHSTNAVDRPWIGWFDENNRHVACNGYHTQLTVAEGGTILKQFEIKTVASSGGGNPTELRTRFALPCDTQRGTGSAGFNFLDFVEINQGENPILTTPGSVTPFGLRLRTAPQDTFTSANFVAAQFTAQVDASDNVIAFLDCNVPYLSGGSLFPGNKTATLDIFRNTHTSSASSPQIAVKIGDGSNTNAFLFTCPSGKLETSGPLGINGSAAPAKPTVTGAKGSNAALGSLLTALASYGLITDSTTA